MLRCYLQSNPIQSSRIQSDPLFSSWVCCGASSPIQSNPLYTVLECVAVLPPSVLFVCLLACLFTWLFVYLLVCLLSVGFSPIHFWVCCGATSICGIFSFPGWRRCEGRLQSWEVAWWALIFLPRLIYFFFGRSCLSPVSSPLSSWLSGSKLSKECSSFPGKYFTQVHDTPDICLCRANLSRRYPSYTSYLDFHITNITLDNSINGTCR